MQQCFHPSAKHLLHRWPTNWWRNYFHVVGHKGTSKKLEKFCYLNWQLWHHQHWNMTSFTFVSMF